MSLRAVAWSRLPAMILAAVSTTTLAAAPASPEASVPHGQGLATKKDTAAAQAEADAAPLMATLVQVHSGQHVALDLQSPSDARFESLLADRSTNSQTSLDPRLLGLLRALAIAHPGSSIELVSGYRSAKLNEMLRKKGHNVSSHSQHSLGRAVDFRIVPADADKALAPRAVEREVRALGWKGGVGVYPTSGDWFVHCDVGRNRHWRG